MINVKENRSKLVAALRSSKYKQGSLLLHGEDKFCCLGVACDLYDPGVWTKFVDSRTNKVIYKYDGYATSAMPLNVISYYGFNTDKGSFDFSSLNESNLRVLAENFISVGQEHGSLMFLNDNGISFNDIADIIESEPEGMFSS